MAKAKRGSPEYRIGKLALGPGDILVINVRDEMRADAMRKFSQQWSGMIPENRLLIVSGDVELSVLTPADMPAK